MKIKLLTKRQNEVMSVLWGSDLPLSANQICNENESLNMNTVQQVLKALLKMQLYKGRRYWILKYCTYKALFTCG